MNTSHSIPETAKLTGIPEHAIREYAKQFADVLPTPETNGDTGRAAVKRYPDSALAVFRSIRKLKDDGLDSATIRDVLHAHTPDEIWEAGAESTPTVEASEAEYPGERAEEMVSGEEAPIDAAAGEGTETVEESAEQAADGSVESQSEEWIETTSEGEIGETTGETPAEVEAACETILEASAEPASAMIEESCEIIEEGTTADGEIAADTVAGEENSPCATMAAEESLFEGPIQEAAVDQEPAIEEDTAAEGVATIAEEGTGVTATFHPLFTNLNDGLRQLRKIMDENVDEREALRSEREQLLAEAAAKQEQIGQLMATVASQTEKIGGLQSALSALMNQCDQQLQAIRSALGQS